MRRVLLALLAGVGVLVTPALAPVPAYAHDQLLSSDPSDGVVVKSDPGEIVLTYSGPISRRFGKVAVTGPDGAAYADGGLRVVGKRATQGLRPLGPAGKYVVGWRVVSSDGHAISGSYAFYHRSKTSDAGSSDSGDGGSTALGVVAGVVAVLVVAAGIVLVMTRRARRRREQR